ncbi:MAG: LD-carboxypeptidase [Bdellovibrionales bacterium]|nr:LD-carboxypeptidase [Bdellovibrionales bacterium]
MTIPSLSSSSVIDLVAPGSSVTVDQIQESVKQVEALGFKARLQVRPVNLQVSDTASFIKPAITSEKFQFLKKALTVSDSEAVWCIRGGYGSQKLMPYLLRMKQPQKPKIFIGYSDVTVIQLFLAQKWKWPSLHFPVLVHVKDSSSAALRRFKALLTGIQKQQSFSGLKLLNPECVSQKQGSIKNKKDHFSQSLDQTGIKKKTTKEIQIHSYLVGGNLSLIQSSIGTPWMSFFKNKILFLEDIREAPYRLDRALWQMWKAGVFQGVKALVLGDFIPSRSGNYLLRTLSARGKKLIETTKLKQGQSNYRSKNFDWEVKQVFRAFSRRVSFPVLAGVPCGHGSKKEALPFLTPCSLKIPVEGKTSLNITSPFI